MLFCRSRTRLQPSWLVCLALVLGSVPRLLAEDTLATKQPVDFERHIAPLLGRLGCNTAACHGAFGGGKGGLQLSLFGYSAKMDFQNLKDRIDAADPKSSLLLRKPSGLEEHEGGVRYEPDSETFNIIERWIEEGAQWREGSGRVKRLTVEPSRIAFSPASNQQEIEVSAEFVDGSREAVTHLCQFTSRDEGIAVVEPNGRVMRANHGDTSIIVSYGNAFASVSALAPFPDSAIRPLDRALSPTNDVDLQLDEKLALLNIVPSPPATDAEFLRRVTLDTIGTIPSADEVTRFCSNSDADKREKKIDALLSHPMHAALWATRMCDITKCDVGDMGEDELSGARRAQMWHDWFRQRFEQNISYAEIVRGIVTATSREDRDVDEWMKHEEQLIHRSRASFDSDYEQRKTLDLFWRRVYPDNDTGLKETAELIAVAFTGIRLNCAQCHKHPFDRWTQDDYASFANIFSNVIFGSSNTTNSAILAELKRRKQAKMSGEAVQPLPRIREVFLSKDLGRALSGSEHGIDVFPRPFDGPKLRQEEDLRAQFFDWLVAADNPYFARSFANRVWAIYFGIGLVDPVDDFSVANPPSHPKLLDELAHCFRESGFYIRALEKRILMSSAYQRSSTPNESNRSDRRNLARQQVRPLLAEVALDTLNKALGTSEPFGHVAPPGALAIEVGTNRVPGPEGKALEALGRGKRETTCDCDRRVASNLRQFIFLANDQSLMQKIRTGSINQLLTFDDRELVSQLYLRTLGRPPDAEEAEFSIDHLSSAESREAAFHDLVWALVNSREFISNH